MLEYTLIQINSNTATSTCLLKIQALDLSFDFQSENFKADWHIKSQKSVRFLQRKFADRKSGHRSSGRYAGWSNRYSRYATRNISSISLDNCGRITDKQFCDWSERVREQKKKCDRDIISAEEIYAWLKTSE